MLICWHHKSDILAEKQNETAELAAEYKRVDNEYNAKKEHLRDLMREAEKIAPSAEWKDRLGQEDIPATLEDIDNEIDEAELRVGCNLNLFLSLWYITTHDFTIVHR